MAESIAAVAAVAAAIFAAVALAVALRAKEIAETANDIAEGGNTLADTANSTAAEALKEAEKANEFADQANELAGEANRIADRALHAALDDIPYNWVLNIDDDGAAVIHNDCGHHARLVSVTLDSEGVVVGECEQVDIAPFGTITLDAKDAVEGHLDRVRKNPVVHARDGGDVFIAGRNGKSVSTTFRAHLKWNTTDGLPRTAVCTEVLRHAMRFKGLTRIRPRPERPV